MAGDPYDAIVIGAGLNGLAAAATLARAGRRTLVLERNDMIGGSCAPFEFAPGFHASPLGPDCGWIPPAVVRGTGLELAESDANGGVERAPRAESSARSGSGSPAATSMHTQPSFSVAVEPGRFLTVPPGSRHAESLAPFSTRDAAAWPAFVERLRSMCGFLESLYQRPAPDVDATATGELLGLARMAVRLRGLGRTGMTDLLRTVPMSVAELLDDTFESEALKAAIAAVAVRGLRQGPRSGGTAFSLLHNIAGAGDAPAPAWAGRLFPGGPGALVAAFEDAAKRAGAAIRTDARVEHVDVDDYAVAGVVLETGEEIAAQVVLSSADPSRTLLGMVDPIWLDPDFMNAVRNIRYRGCTSFVLYALDGMPDLPGFPDTASMPAAVVSLTPAMESLERAYDATKYGEIGERQHIEVGIPGRPQRAGQPVSVVARVHYDHAAAEAREAGAPADRVTDAIQCVIPGFAERVLHRVALSVRDIEERWGYTGGAMSQGEMALDQILFMRPVAGWSRYAMPVDGLYLCGAGTHPGPGVAGGPGWLAAREVLRPARR